MHTLRSLNRLRWWIAACFILSLGTALASALVQPRGMELVCSAGSGATLVVHAKTGNAVLDTLGADCALCLLGSAPPQPSAPNRPALPAAHALPVPPLQAQPVTPMAAPPPARGPPSFFV